MIERMGVRIRSEDAADIIRMRKKDRDEAMTPVIIEFKSEYDKWVVLSNKFDLREKEEYKSFFGTGFVKRVCEVVVVLYVDTVVDVTVMRVLLFVLHVCMLRECERAR